MYLKSYSLAIFYTGSIEVVKFAYKNRASSGKRKNKQQKTDRQPQQPFLSQTLLKNSGDCLRNTRYMLLKEDAVANIVTEEKQLLLNVISLPDLNWVRTQVWFIQLLFPAVFSPAYCFFGCLRRPESDWAVWRQDCGGRKRVAGFKDYRQSILYLVMFERIEIEGVFF